jgi:hypothetical protein
VTTLCDRLTLGGDLVGTVGERLGGSGRWLRGGLCRRLRILMWHAVIVSFVALWFASEPRPRSHHRRKLPYFFLCIELGAKLGKTVCTWLAIQLLILWSIHIWLHRPIRYWQWRTSVIVDRSDWVLLWWQMISFELDRHRIWRRFIGQVLFFVFSFQWHVDVLNVCSHLPRLPCMLLIGVTQQGRQLRLLLLCHGKRVSVSFGLYSCTNLLEGLGPRKNRLLGVPR